jgi:hypothetical protein
VKSRGNFWPPSCCPGVCFLAPAAGECRTTRAHDRTATSRSPADQSTHRPAHSTPGPGRPIQPPRHQLRARRATAHQPSCIFVFLAHTITSTIPISGKNKMGKLEKKIVIVREHSQTARGAHVAASLTDTVNIPPIHHPGEGAFDFSRLCSAPPPVHLTPPSPPSSDLPRARARI